MFVIQPAHAWWKIENWKGGKPLPDGFTYTSSTNPEWLSVDELRRIVTAVA